jgi:peptidoglycan/LPS O-acetylase OafA/YrhL
MSAAINANPTRYDFLDWLRVIAIFVLLFFHTGMIFVGWGWHIENAQTISWLALPMDLLHRLRMPLLFVIAGAGLWFAMGSRTLGAVLKERSLRLLVPVVAGMFLIVPPQIYFERLFRGQWHGGYGQFFLQKVLEFQPYPQGNFSWHHLWFVVYLYVYVLVLLPALAWWRRRGATVRPGVWMTLLAIPLGLNEAILKPLFPEAHNLVADWYIFNHYLLLTVAGCALASIEGAWDWLAMHRHKLAVASVASLTMVLALLNVGVLTRGSLIEVVLANAFTWTAVLAFIGYGRAHLSFQNSLIRWARDASYPIYILHQTIIVAVGFYVIVQPWAAGMKYWVILATTLVSCVLLYQFVVRRFAITRLLFGMKATGPTSAGQPFQAATLSR